MSKKRRNNFHKGKYNVINVSKYLGDLTKVEYRSSWELFFMGWLDMNPNVRKWNSEGVIIDYYSKMDQKNRRYYVDFYVEFMNGTKLLYEIKPHKQTIPPNTPKTNTPKALKRFSKEKYDFNVNLDKWRSAKDSARLSGMDFKVLNEHHLKQIGMVI